MFESSRFKSFLPSKSHLWSLGAFLSVLLCGIAASLLTAEPPPVETAIETASAPDVPTVATASPPPIPPVRPARRPADSAEKLGVRPPPAPDPVITAGIRATANSGERTFVRYENRDMFGGDYDSLSNSSQEACETRCRSDRRCRAYTFNKWQEICFLKSSVGVVRIEPQGTTGIAMPATVKEAQRPPSIQRSAGRRLPGVAYRTLSGRGYDGCAAACLRDGQCLGFNYSRIERTCALMASADKPTRAKTSDIGIKLQRATRRTRPARVGPFPPGDIPPEFRPVFDTFFRGVVRF